MLQFCSDHYIHTIILSIRPPVPTQLVEQTVGLAEWITDDSSLVDPPGRVEQVVIILKRGIRQSVRPSRNKNTIQHYLGAPWVTKFFFFVDMSCPFENSSSPCFRLLLTYCPTVFCESVLINLQGDCRAIVVLS